MLKLYMQPPGEQSMANLVTGQSVVPLGSVAVCGRVLEVEMRAGTYRVDGREQHFGG